MDIAGPVDAALPALLAGGLFTGHRTEVVHQPTGRHLPVWWWSFPATLKDRIDRVWRKGWA